MLRARQQVCARGPPAFGVQVSARGVNFPVHIANPVKRAGGLELSGKNSHPWRSSKHAAYHLVIIGNRIAERNGWTE